MQSHRKFPTLPGKKALIGEISVCCPCKLENIFKAKKLVFEEDNLNEVLIQGWRMMSELKTTEKYILGGENNFSYQTPTPLCENLFNSFHLLSFWNKRFRIMWQYIESQWCTTGKPIFLISTTDANHGGITCGNY